jgi:hypothetical protein
VIVVCLHGWVVRSSGGCCPSRVMGEFSADFTFRTSCEVVDMVLWLRLSRSHRLATKKAESNESDDFVDSGRKTPCIQKWQYHGGGGVLACEEVLMDRASREVSGPSQVNG